MAGNSVSPKKIDDSELRIWDRIELDFFEKERSGQYIARIEDIRAEGLVISRPEWMRGEPLFTVGAVCRVTYIRQICAYQFASKVMQSATEKGKRHYVLSAPVSIRRIQRRRFVRVDLATPFHFKDMSEVLSGGKQFIDVEWREATTHNLSAGGIGCYVPSEIQKGSVLAVKLTLPELDRTFQMLGRIARCVKEKDAVRWYVGIELFTREEMASKLRNVRVTKIPDALKRFGEWERNVLVNFIFNEEIKIRRRETV